MASTLQSLAGTDDETDDETGALPQAAPDEAVASYSPRAHERLSKMLQELRKQRVGPSESEKWWALASALATPVARGQGRFGQVLGNVAQSMTAYEGARSKENKEKDALIARYELGLASLEDKAQTALETAKLKAKSAGGLKDADQRKRLGYVQMLYPKLSLEEQMSPRLLYSSAVERMMMRPGVLTSAYTSGTAPPEDFMVPTEAQQQAIIQQGYEAIKKGAKPADVAARMRDLGIVPPEDMQ